MISFSITRWAAWAPELKTNESWVRWAHDTSRLDEDTAPQPDLKKVSPMLRRRLDLPGKMAIATAMDCLGDSSDIPIVFCSRHGEVARSAGMLSSIANGEPVSPTAFSLSVHNAVAGLLSIIRHDYSNLITISSRADLVEAGIIEACGILNDGNQKVLLVVYNHDIPECFSAYKDQEERTFAFALLIEKNGKDTFSLSWDSSHGHSPNKIDMPSELAVLKFILSGQKTLKLPSKGRIWYWSRNV